MRGYMGFRVIDAGWSGFRVMNDGDMWFEFRVIGGGKSNLMFVHVNFFPLFRWHLSSDFKYFLFLKGIV